ncbi:hypothetical protein C4Q28_11410 [Pseudomonas sp. SWI6]|uniref:hypothetical protein n=1 Tax=Pseudomonas sp. SWI6 TaxID=2083051 RepID=UPI000CE5E3EA|nr:hypothetical protein [Pseudomonas sp. SWI6]AVD82716.1 hypothetical protein C4Q28_11410 [Pseudomonas sp. SWI6]
MAWDTEEVARHDKHQKATIGYALEVIKLLFVISGGALATCSAFFSERIGLPATILSSARWAWVSLTIAIILFSAALLLVLARDYVTGERWRERIEKDKDWEISAWWDRCAWASGLIGLVAFWVGMIAFAVAAWDYLGQASILLAPSLP